MARPRGREGGGCGEKDPSRVWVDSMHLGRERQLDTESRRGRESE